MSLISLGCNADVGVIVADTATLHQPEHMLHVLRWKVYESEVVVNVNRANLSTGHASLVSDCADDVGGADLAIATHVDEQSHHAVSRLPQLLWLWLRCDLERPVAPGQAGCGGGYLG